MGCYGECAWVNAESSRTQTGRLIVVTHVDLCRHCEGSFFDWRFARTSQVIRSTLVGEAIANDVSQPPVTPAALLDIDRYFGNQGNCGCDCRQYVGSFLSEVFREWTTKHSSRIPVFAVDSELLFDAERRQMGSVIAYVRGQAYKEGLRIEAFSQGQPASAARKSQTTRSASS